MDVIGSRSGRLVSGVLSSVYVIEVADASRGKDAWGRFANDPATSSPWLCRGVYLTSLEHKWLVTTKTDKTAIVQRCLHLGGLLNN